MISDSGNYNAFVLKLDSSGNFTWAKGVGGGGGGEDDRGYSTILDALGNVYVLGYSEGTGDFDPGPGVYNLTTAGTYDVFLLKLDSFGNFVWVKSFGGNASGNYGYGMALDALDNIYLTGCFLGTGDFDPGPGTHIINSISTSDDIFILKLNSTGDFVWVKNMGGTSYAQAQAIALDSAGNIYIINQFQGTMDFDPGAAIYSITNSPSSYPNSVISKLDSAGNFICAKAITGYNYPTAVALGATGNIYATGFFQTTCDMDPDAGIFNLTSSGGNDGYILKLGTTDVWPGDADHTNLVDNLDLLPIGLFYGSTGIPRSGISNSWQSYGATDWGVLESGGADIKHADCNGNGLIDYSDTLAVSMNFSLTHAFVPFTNDIRTSIPELHFVASSGTYSSGSAVDVEVWVGTSATPVSNLYGLAFDINYDASLVQSGSEGITYPSSWLGTRGVDALTISKGNPPGNTFYGGETRIDHVNASGFGKIADFKFILKNAIPSNTPMIFSFTGYSANDSSGLNVPFNTSTDSIMINSTAGIKEINNNVHIDIYPNPSNGVFNISCAKVKNMTIEIYNSLGDLVCSKLITNVSNYFDLSNQPAGLYFAKIMSENKILDTEKIMKE